MPHDPIAEIARECIAVRVRMLNRYVTARCDAGLRGHGLRVSQVNILVAAGHAGPLSPGELAAALVMDKSTVSRDVEALLANGWLRKAAADDKRSHKLELTAAGRDKVLSILPAWRAAQKELKDSLGADNLGGLFAAVASVRPGMRS